MGDEKARPGRPRVRAVAPLASEDRQIVAVDDREGEAEFRFEFALPLSDHAGGRSDEDKINPPAQQQLAQDEPRLDGLARADVVGD